MTTEEKIVSILTKRGWHIAFAESCTGGLAAASIVGVPGASDVLEVSFVTYSPSAKMAYLGVNPDTIARLDVVSEAVAAQMASGVATRTGAQVGIGITGYAGPGGGTQAAPEGTVCFGFSVNGMVSTKTVRFGAIGRNVVRSCAAEFAENHLLSLLTEET